MRGWLAILALAPALGAGASEIELSWPPAAAGGELRVERRSPGGAWSELARLPHSASSYVDSGLSREETWCYRVRHALGERVRTHAAEHCVGPSATVDAPRSKRTRVRGGWLQEVEP